MKFKSKSTFRSGWVQRLSEALVFPMVFLFICHLVNPHDPLFLRGTFPWPWVAPFLIAIRYGMVYGLISSAVVVAGLFVLEPAGVLEALSYRYFILGGILITFVSAEFNERFYARVLRAEQFNSYTRERLKTISNAYYVMKLSHDRLQNSMISKPTSLRHTFEEFHQLAMKFSGELTLETAERFLYLLSEQCAIEKAGFYLWKHKKVEKKPLVHIGSEEKLVMNDVLIEKAMKNENLNYFGVNQLEDMVKSHYLAVVPVMTSGGEKIGLIAIETMSFWALNEETMKKMMALSLYFADTIWNTRVAFPLLKKHPDCSRFFAAELDRLSQLKRNLNIDSKIAAYRISHQLADHEEILNALQKQQRNFDTSWLIKQDDHSVLIILMPFFPGEVIEIYYQRIKKWLKQQFDVSFSKDVLRLYYEDVPPQEADEFISRFLKILV